MLQYNNFNLRLNLSEQQMPHEKSTGRNPASKNEIDIEKRDKTAEKSRIKQTIKTF